MILAQFFGRRFSTLDPLCKIASIARVEDFEGVSGIFRLLARFMQIFVGTIGLRLVKRLAAFAVDACDARDYSGRPIARNTPVFNSARRGVYSSRACFPISRALKLAVQIATRLLQRTPQFQYKRVLHASFLVGAKILQSVERNPGVAHAAQRPGSIAQLGV